MLKIQYLFFIATLLVFNGACDEDSSDTDNDAGTSDGVEDVEEDESDSDISDDELQPTDDSDEENFTISSDVASGLINGEEWVYGDGSFSTYQGDENRWHITIIEEQEPGYELCSRRPEGAGFHFILDKGAEVGDHLISTSGYLSFYSENSSAASSTGLFRVTSFDGTTMTGGVVSDYTDRDNVNGQFTATYCPWPPEDG